MFFNNLVKNDNINTGLIIIRGERTWEIMNFITN